MSTSAMRQKVTEAVHKILDMIGQMHDAKAALLVAKQNEDEVRLSDQTKVVERAVADKLQVAKATLNSEFEAAVVLARVPLSEAQQQYEIKVSAQANQRTQALAVVEDECAEMIRSERQRQDMRVATVQAEIHTARRNVTDFEAMIDAYRREVQKELGIDLNALILVSK